MNSVKVTWTYLRSEVEMHPVEGILVDHTTHPISIRLRCHDHDGWFEGITKAHLRELHAEGKLPGHISRYLTGTGILKR